MTTLIPTCLHSVKIIFLACGAVLMAGAGQLQAEVARLNTEIVSGSVALAREIAFIDSAVEDPQALISELSSGVEVVLLKPGADGLEQIAECLRGRGELATIHIFSHGAPGRIQLGNKWLDHAGLAAQERTLSVIGESMSVDGDILLYGCEVGSSESGTAFIQRLATATGADVAASTTLTGAANKGGDWVLESSTGVIAADTFSARAYRHILNTLNAGDVVVLGWNSIGSTDTVIFAATMDIPGGTVIKFTDFGWDQFSNAFATGTTADGTISWTTSGTISAGNVFTLFFGGLDQADALTNVTTNTNLNADIARVGLGWTSANDPMLAVGDGVFIYQDSAANPFFIFGFNNSAGTVDGSNWNTSVVIAGRDSMIPNGVGSQNALINGINAVGLPGGGAQMDNVQYTGPISSADRATWLSRVSNVSNWSGDDVGTITTSIGITSGSFMAMIAPAVPTITNATYDASTGALTVTGTDFSAVVGATNDVIANKFTITGQAGSTYTLTDTANVEIGSATAFTLTLSSTDRAAVNLLLNQNGTSSAGGTTYNLAGAAGFLAASAAADTTGNGITVSNFNPAPVIDANGATGGTANTATFTENGGAIRIATSDATLSDDDNLASLTLVLAATPNGASELISYNAALNGGASLASLGLTGGYVSGTRTYTVSGTASAAVYQGVLRAMQYNNSSDDPATAARTVTITATDAESATGQATATINITTVNDAPTLTATGSSPTFIEGGGAVDLFSSVTANTVESAQTFSSMTLTVANVSNGASEILTIGGTDVALVNGNSGTLTGIGSFSVSVASGTATVAVTGMTRSSAQMGTLVDGITYRNSSHNPGSTSRVVTITQIVDSGGTANGGVDSTALSLASTVSVTPTNDAPSASNLTQNKAATEAGGAVALDDVVVADVDTGETITATFTLSSPAAGTLSTGTYGSATSSYNAGTGLWTVTGSVADVNAALAAVAFTPSANNDQNFTITTRVRDAADTGPADGTISITVTGINDAPSASNLTQNKAATEADGAVALDDVVVTDADTGETITATFTLSSAAAGTLSTGTYGSATSSYNAGTGVWTVTGSVADVNAALAAVAFTPSANNDQNFTITTRIRDAATTGPADGTISFTVTATNDAPVLTAPASISVNEDTATALTGVSVSDVDAGSGSVTTSFSVASGTLAATSGSGIVVVGSGTGTLTLNGTVANTNAFIAASGISFTTASNATSNVVLTVTVDDGGNTGSDPGLSGTVGSEADTGTVTLLVTAVNDAPVNTVPTAQSTDQDAAIVFSTGNGNQISIQDVDAGGSSLEVTLTASNGLVTLSGTTGLVFTVGDGASDATMTFEGSITDINTALSGAAFTPTPGYIGVASLQITTGDGGNTGSGGAKTDADSVAIAVNPTNPTVSSVSSISADKTYKIGDSVVMVVNFSEAVFLSTGTIELTLETGATDRAATYLAGSGSSSIHFSYTVQSGDISSDLDFAGTTALVANGDTIQSGSFIDANLTLPSPGAAGSIAAGKAIVIDGVRPTASIVVTDTALAAGETSIVTVTFNEAVSGFDNNDLTIANGTLTPVSSADSGITWTATLTPTANLESTANLITLDNTDVADTAGNAGTGTTDSNNYAIDTKRPTATIVVADTSLTQGETSLVTITFSEAVTGFANADLTLSNGTLTAVSSTDGDITWTATFAANTGVTAPANLITLDNTKVADLAGNTGTGTTDSNNFAIDNVAPGAPSAPDLAQASDSGSSDADNITNITTPTFTGTAEAGSTVELLRGGATSLGTTTANGAGNWTFTVGTALPEGVHSITARATDTAGQTGAASGALSVTIDTTAPAVPAFAKISDDTGSDATDQITSDTTLVLSGTAPADETVTVFRNATQIGTSTADTHGDWSFDYTATILAAGSHTFTATTTDAAGNTSAASAVFLVEIDTDTPSAPLIVAISNDTGASATDGITSDATLLFAGTADANVTVTLSRSGAGTVGTTTANATGVWSFDYSATTLPDGSYLFTAFASDTAGNDSTVSADFPVTIDTTAPAISAQPVGGTFVIGDSFTLMVVANDATALAYQWSRDASALSDSTGRSGSATASLAHSNITLTGFEGAYTVSLTDLAGNVTTSNVATVVVNKIPATITLGDLEQTYTGSPRGITSTTTPPGLTVSISYTGSATAPTDAGSYAVVATIDDASYAGTASGTLVINKADQSVAFPVLASITVGTPVTLVATASSGLPVTFALISGNATLSGATLTANDADPLLLRATQSGDSNYNAATADLVVSNITKLSQAIDFVAPGDRSRTAPAFALSATASSTLPVSFTVESGPATISGNTVTLTGVPGLVTIRARQTGNAVYAAATDVLRSFNVAADYPAPEADGFASSVTGGAGSGSQSVTVTTAADFRTHAESSSTAIITVVGTLDLGATPVAVKSNKTIQGADASATLIGNLSLGSGTNNVILRGLNLTNPGTTLVNGAYSDGGDAVTISGARNVFITHSTFFDAADHAVRIVNGADDITVSWSEFYYTAAQAAHRFSMVIGNPGSETAPIHVSLHHNRWGAGVEQAMPTVNFGYVHLYNNVFDVSGNTRGTEALAQAQILSEHNVYNGVANPLTRGTANGALPAGRIMAFGNVYNGTTGTPPAAADENVFVPEYSYEALPAADVTSLVATGAGNNGGAESTDTTTGRVVLTARIDGPAQAVTKTTAFTLTAVSPDFTATSYQWRLNNVTIAGANAATYTVPFARAGDAGVYTVALGLASEDTVVSAPFTVELAEPPYEHKLKPDGDGQGGGGAPSLWYLGALLLAWALRSAQRRGRGQGSQ